MHRFEHCGCYMTSDCPDLFSRIYCHVPGFNSRRFCSIYIYIYIYILCVCVCVCVCELVFLIVHRMEHVSK